MENSTGATARGKTLIGLLFKTLLKLCLPIPSLFYRESHEFHPLSQASFMMKKTPNLISFQTLLGLCVSICNSSFWAQAWNWLYPFISLSQRLVKMSPWHIYIIRFSLPSVHSQTHSYSRKQCVIFLSSVFGLYSWLERHVNDLFYPFYSSQP